jgi:hypothetical protein
MTRNLKLLWVVVGLLALLVTCCIGVVLGSAITRDKARTTAPRDESGVRETVQPIPTPVHVTESADQPTSTNTRVVPPPVEPPAPTPVPQRQPGGPAGDLQALAAYAAAIKPILDEGLAAAERDGQILEASKEAPEALCGGERAPHPVLVADAALMHGLARQLDEVTPPAEAAGSVHQPLRESMQLWGDALNNVNRSCQQEPAARGLSRVGATLQLGGSLLNFRIASDNFWRLVLVNGIEAIVGTPKAP